MWHVVHIITKLELGGAQLATLYEAANTQFTADKASLFHGTGGLLDEQAAAKTTLQDKPIVELVREVAPRRDLKALKSLVRELKKIKRSGSKLLVHTHSSKAGILGRWAARIAGAGLVVHSVHGFGHSHHGSRAQRGVFKALEWVTGRITDGFTADSATNIHQGRGENLFGDAPARVIYCGIDAKAFGRSTAEQRAAHKKKLNVPRGYRVVLGLSCLKPQKDPMTFIRTAHRVREQFPKVMFLLAGDGELRPQAEMLIDELNLQETVQLLGWRQDVPELLGITDVLLHTSLWEGLPQVFAQAMASSVPIVATDVDGAPEAIAHGENGFLTQAKAVDALATHTLSLLEDTQLRKTMGKAGKARVHQFTQEKMVADLDEFYRSLAGI